MPTFPLLCEQQVGRPNNIHLRREGAMAILRSAFQPFGFEYSEKWVGGKCKVGLSRFPKVWDSESIWNRFFIVKN